MTSTVRMILVLVPWTQFTARKPAMETDVSAGVDLPDGSLASCFKTSKSSPKGLLVELEATVTENDEEEDEYRLMIEDANKKWNDFYGKDPVVPRPESNAVNEDQGRWQIKVPKLSDGQPGPSILKSASTSVFYSSTSTMHMNSKGVIHASKTTLCIRVDEVLHSNIGLKPEIVGGLDGMKLHMKTPIIMPEDVDAASCSKYLQQADQLDSNTTGKKLKKFTLNLCAQFRVLHTWKKAHALARKGPWEQMRRDRMRFMDRITGQFLRTLSPILEQKHREKVYAQRFSEGEGVVD